MSATARITLTVTAPTEEQITAWHIDELRRLGFAVSEPHPPETVGQFCQRLGICNATLLRKVASPFCPEVMLERGKVQILSLRSNPAFEAFCLNGYARPNGKKATRNA